MSTIEPKDGEERDSKPEEAEDSPQQKDETGVEEPIRDEDGFPFNPYRVTL